MQYPGIVQIETSGACNARCGFCPHSTMNRTSEDRMSMELFLKIVNEIKEWPVRPAQICPFLTNEPFADNRVYGFCKIINAAIPESELVFFTNGSLFTDGNLDKLSEVDRIKIIHVSLHHSNKEAYEVDLGLNWEKTLASIHRLIDRQKWRVRLLRVSNGNRTEDQAFVDFCAKEFPGTETQNSYRYNWKGDIKSHIPYENTLDIICPRHNSMTILCDGRVALCCMDENGDYSLGDANETSLLEIYNGPKALSYRTRVKRWSEPCGKCNMA